MTFLSRLTSVASVFLFFASSSSSSSELTRAMIEKHGTHERERERNKTKKITTIDWQKQWIGTFPHRTKQMDYSVVQGWFDRNVTQDQWWGWSRLKIGSVSNTANRKHFERPRGLKNKEMNNRDRRQSFGLESYRNIGRPLRPRYG